MVMVKKFRLITFVMKSSTEMISNKMENSSSRQMAQLTQKKSYKRDLPQRISHCQKSKRPSSLQVTRQQD